MALNRTFVRTPGRWPIANTLFSAVLFHEAVDVRLDGTGIAFMETGTLTMETYL